MSYAAARVSGEKSRTRCQYASTPTPCIYTKAKTCLRYHHKLSLVKSKCLKYNNPVCIADSSVLCGTSSTILCPTLLAQRRVVHHYALEISYKSYQIYPINTSRFFTHFYPLACYCVTIQRQGSYVTVNCIKC